MTGAGLLSDLTLSHLPWPTLPNSRRCWTIPLCMSSPAARRCPRRPWPPATRAWRPGAHLEVTRCGATGWCACVLPAWRQGQCRRHCLLAVPPPVRPRSPGWWSGPRRAAAMERKPRAVSWLSCERVDGPSSLISIPVTWPPNGWPAAPGCRRPPTSVTARYGGSARRLRRRYPRPRAHVAVSIDRADRPPRRRLDPRMPNVQGKSWDPGGA